MLQDGTDFKQDAENSQTQDASDLIILDQDEKAIYLADGQGSVHIDQTSNQRTKNGNKQSNNLAMVLAKRMPLNVRQDVVKIVEYYEEHMEDQLKQIHRLVKENKNYERQLELSQNKENRIVQVEDPSCKRQRIEELEEYVLDKNKQIVNLNNQITELLTKLKRYKKRVLELEARSPIKSVVSEFM